ncbi:uncharacterized protein LOC124834531 [Vigna umbellata]|uniref:uncharacterized protein LOC124834531 n=1 Tax=Vigna umbellata TaxID=87088 RepID=UPI001F5F46EE|nr:uncharacterized protein LOC124834531 [Vigna umbellata]
MKIYDDDVINASGSVGVFRCTRFQEALDWSIIESLILVNEIAAVEADCSVALSSYQQWNIIAQNCVALDVQRKRTQCRRKWHALLSDYDCFKGTANAGGKLPPNFDYELFEAVERVVKAREERGMADPESNPKQGTMRVTPPWKLGPKGNGNEVSSNTAFKSPNLNKGTRTTMKKSMRKNHFFHG